MSKRIAYYALHYGKEFLAWSVRSIQDAVDEIHVLYTDTPSYGHSQGLACPDSEDELKREAHRFATKPIFWHRGNWPTESAHRETIRHLAPTRDAHLVLVVDADEVWDSATAKTYLDSVERHNNAGTIGARFVHFWKNIDWACNDPCMPIRALDLRHPAERAWYSAEQPHPVLHFGYAQSEALMRYKWSCHGHQRELRPEWFDRFLYWKPGVNDVHPTNRNFWTPEPVTGALKEKVAELLFDHPEVSFREQPSALSRARDLARSILMLPDDRPDWLRSLPYANEERDTHFGRYYRFFWELARREKLTRVLEVGCDKGGAIAHLAAGCHPEGKCVTIDSHPDAKRSFEGLSLLNAKMLFGDSASPEIVEQAAAEGPYNLVFIDAGHTFENMKRDFETYFPLVRDGGLLFFDDINYPELRRAWDTIPSPKIELPELHWTGFGVCERKG